MKIGILTFHRGPNYGGFLQAWHMREAVRGLGIEATLVNYQSDAHLRAENKGLDRLSVAGVRSYLHRRMKARPFATAVRELSDEPFTTDPAAVHWSEFERIIVGADIVWDFSNPVFGSDPVWFGAHPAQAGSRFAAYAPSCGPADPGAVLIPEHIARGLRQFDTIQVRDEPTARLVERVVGVKPPIVVDPTWLQPDPEVICPGRPEFPYVLVYGYGAARPGRADVLGAWAEMNGLRILTAASPCPSANIRLRSIPVFGWVDLFRHASAVVTSTFHGLLYAIKFNKPFVFSVNPASRSKSSTIIDRCGLTERVVEEDQPFHLDHLDQWLKNNQGCEIPSDWVTMSRELLQHAVRR